MLSQFFTYILLSASLFVPIIIWSYIFTFIDGSKLNKKRFVFWIIAGGIGVLPVLYSQSFFDAFWLGELDIFSVIYSLWNFWSYILLLISLGMIFLWIVSIPSGIFYAKNLFAPQKIFKIFPYIFLIFGMGIMFLITQIFFTLFPSLNVFVSESIYFDGYIFNSLQLVIFYYLVIAFLEEMSKYWYFRTLDTPLLHSIKTSVLGVIFVALWFSFIENILYIFSLSATLWFWGELVKVGVFRSIFSTMLHVVCSAVIVYGTGSLLFPSQKSFKKLALLSTPFYVGIMLHALYDVTLSFNLGFIMLLYLLGWYLYVWSIFYHDQEIPGEEIG